ncbi:NEP1-interacting protein 2-like isoform X2 [Nymphaea colorata]|uniref:NEP1-interacting protein 2-like isoform X2 n=1 Tax=Nymphaea colorata TaxID=210225 RepID=UPI00129DD34D|nr:NEP1-interacting protein 2-like isoform X2 [Nymphaea colorata]
MESVTVRVAWKILKGFTLAALTSAFALVGAIVGLGVGAVRGQTAEIGCAQGAKVGAFNGVIVSIEILDSTISGGPFSLMAIFSSLLSGKFFQERMRRVIVAAYRRQASAVDMSYEDLTSLFDVSATKGMSSDSITRLPEFVVGRKRNAGAGENQAPCSICLQELSEGDSARSLPKCRHHFHVGCIDRWLILEGSCPICRQDVR